MSSRLSGVVPSVADLGPLSSPKKARRFVGSRVSTALSQMAKTCRPNSWRATRKCSAMGVTPPLTDDERCMSPQ